MHLKKKERKTHLFVLCKCRHTHRGHSKSAQAGPFAVNYNTKLKLQ
jgi:hypothetical protein